MKKRFGVLFAFILLFSACSGQQKGLDLNLAQEIVIPFENTDPWDMEFRKLMDSQINEIEVPITSKVTAAEFPKLLNKWTTAVYEKEGTIEHIRPESKLTRGVLLDVITLAKEVFDHFKEKGEVKAAKYYNAEIYYEQRDGDEVINKVVFKRKPQ